ncbi:MAG TPA: hypothetical protein VJ697_10500 [Nitrososphaeraceae archaeon]|nr:hypothetical protein [Nitrososphaeraceae archaeon]
MNNVSTKINIYSPKNPIKKCIKIGPLILTPIDESIVEKMRIDGVTTFFEQEITKDGILLRVRDITF